MILDITKPEVSYLMGFLQTDGSLYENTRNRGRLQIELNVKDIDILYKLQRVIPVHTHIRERERKTNFSECIHSAILSAFDLEFREFLILNGLPYGAKHETVTPPMDCSSVDYIRGLIDGNGSIGYTAKDIPYISLCIASESVASFFFSFLKDHLDIRKINNRNKRDNVYNIAVTRNDAVKLGDILYYEGCISLDRKQDLAKTLKWDRPTRKKASFTSEEDQVILNNSIEQAAIILNRSHKSVFSRKWRLGRKGKND